MLKHSISTFARTSFAFLMLAGATSFAGDVKVVGVHLCCGACVKAANKALADVKGVSAVNINKDEETVSFTADDDAAATKGLAALAESGFYGKSETKGPDFKIDPAAAGNEVKITKLHLCCGGCVSAVEDALEDVEGVKSIDTSKSKQGTVTLKGEKINYAAALKALHESGFHGQVGK